MSFFFGTLATFAEIARRLKGDGDLAGNFAMKWENIVTLRRFS
jgi:hypothetical protein